MEVAPSLKPVDLASVAQGYSVVDAPALLAVVTRVFLRHLSDSTGLEFTSVLQAAAYLQDEGYPSFREKPARLLPEPLVSEVLEALEAEGLLEPSSGEYLTGEEGRGFADIYWRVVRPDSPSDVGSIHADDWFWEILGHPRPENFQRVKLWIPILQDDDNPSLLVLPGSHLRAYRFTSVVNSQGQKKPVYADEDISDRLTAAPVRTGQAVLFNYKLLHGGRSTGALRISMEFTLACRPRD
ncbi:MAG: phytanoyl-CoA dioxygenase family protein [Phenylobacterium sp.]|jgi:hypothetical protein|uniref:phytanoyl-CoA dioxygenase family protein n=1 Tax=Phenylobacterium sp. TaxID=1871053 RepID=UPI0025D9290F|nr:phytanoyl-CoA dioxygenase family protein [Phenylobacterium sp.]MCA6299343.1 phytanoyl-CoA dioxygenase family protein [Phenylobacterium sp.]